MSMLERFDAGRIGVSQVAAHATLARAGCSIAVDSDIHVLSLRIDEWIARGSVGIVAAF